MLRPGRDGAAEEFAFLETNVEVGGGSEVDDDGGTSIVVERADAIGDAIGADFARIVGKDGQAGFDSGFDEERLLGEGALAELAENPVDGGTTEAMTTPRMAPVSTFSCWEKTADENAVFVGSLVPGAC